MKFETVQRGYANLWTKAEVVGPWNPKTGERDAKGVAQAAAIAEKLGNQRAPYEVVAAAVGVPWWWIAVCHQMEADGNFKRHLHNGDPLTARTVQVPKGRPKTGKPPFSWTDSAIDALTMSPHSLGQVERWGIARALYELERYNGFGYFAHQINSPYLWSYTTLYERGKYVADGKWSASAVSKQCGAAAIIKAMVAAGMIKL